MLSSIGKKKKNICYNFILVICKKLLTVHDKWLATCGIVKNIVRKSWLFSALSTKEVLWKDVHVLFLCIFSLHCIPVCMYFYEEKKLN